MYLETTGAVDTPIRSTAGRDSIWEFRGDEREVDVYSVHGRRRRRRRCFSAIRGGTGLSKVSR